MLPYPPWKAATYHKQAGRQAGTLLPSGDRSNLSQAGSQAGVPQATAHLPSGEGSSSSQATAYPPEEVSSISQAIALLPPRKGNNSSPAGSQAGTLLPSREGSNSPPAIALLPAGEGSNSSPAGSQSRTLLLTREGSSSSPAIAHLPSGEGSSSFQAVAHLPPEEGSNPSQATAHLPPGEGNSSPHAGQSSNQARSVMQGFRQSTRHRAPQASQENSAVSWEANPTSTTPSRLPQESSNEEPNRKWVINLSNKPLTPAQRSVLAKGPNFAVTPRQPPNLEYITAIEAVCTKLSQQGAEELRADINRVLRSSNPPEPNLTKAQNLALRELKRNRDCIVLTADK